MILETTRLLLREFTEHDLDALFPIMADQEVMRFSLKGPLSREETLFYLKNRVIPDYAKYGFGVWAIIHKEDNRLIGIAGLKVWDIDGKEQTELGYRLDPKYWGRGLAVEAASSICHYAFTKLKKDELISIIEAKNIRSIQVAERIGMRYEKDSIFFNIPVRIYKLKKIALEPYQDAWAKTFQDERAKLLDAFQGLDIEFFHIGSTSIATCSAKPIIDILGVTSDVTQIDKYNTAMSGLGFDILGEYGMKQRRYFRRDKKMPLHLHIFEDTDPEVERHLRFCEYLKAHPESAAEYSQVKLSLAEKFPEDINAYCSGKEEFVKKIDRQAAQEQSLPLYKMKSCSKKSKWSQDEIIKAMDVNMHLQMTYFAKYVPTLQLFLEPDIAVVRSEIPDDTFNYVLSARFSKNSVNARVKYVIELFRKFNLPFSWWTSSLDTPENLAEVLQSNGLVLKEVNSGMYKELAGFCLSESSSELNFQKVQSQKELQDFSDVIVSCGGSDQAYEKLYSKIPPILYLNPPSFEMHIAYLNNQPVVTGIVVMHANVAGIYYVATSPNQRKKGFGTKMMEYLLMRAKDRGFNLATLQASAEGKTLYERLGFKKCCEIKEYAPKA
jgi:GrpB-like predicted nucleotidyltransferase (UPF0157 family)/ribosomal protein S18 acetylase RimI-like enzyme